MKYRRGWSAWRISASYCGINVLLPWHCNLYQEQRLLNICINLRKCYFGLGVCVSSCRAPAYQVWGLEFKPWYCQKTTLIWCWGMEYNSIQEQTFLQHNCNAAVTTYFHLPSITCACGGGCPSPLSTSFHLPVWNSVPINLLTTPLPAILLSFVTSLFHLAWYCQALRML
jgi:hypothetical protein